MVALDARGHGRSERAPSDVSRDAHVADVSFVVERLGLCPVIVIGQSVGGLTALSVAARRPDLVRALVLVEARFGGPVAAEAWAAGLEQRDDGWWPRFEVEVMVRTLREALSAASWEEWKRISCPTLIVRAGNGLIEPDVAQKMLERLPTARLVELRDAAHDLHLDQPDAWRQTLGSFVESLGGGG